MFYTNSILISFRKKLNIKDTIYYVSESWDAVEDQTILNCWRKTGILSSFSYEEIEAATYNQNMLLEQQEENIDNLVIDLTSHNPDLEIKSQLNTYLDLNDSHIITEKKLEDSKIIEIVLDEENQRENGDPDDLDEEQPKIPISEGLIALLNRRYRESKRQTSIGDFFTSLDNEKDYNDVL
ncbi:18163_t:CDS:2 [Dentiscutata erythropus]|uniref:18163_t:CDS:1 n=1 Tax=Dentiscutata erythropus TaxID=1348616 RepID=A0A9N9FKT5_9GLOM|nr:18163_t:CDS:2 [Dentiscutata erythropus]